MFWNRLRDTDRLLESVVIFDSSNSAAGITLDYAYPTGSVSGAVTDRLVHFACPYKIKSTLSEEYLLIFTNLDGTLEFVMCIFLPMSGYIICVTSYMPYFELLHAIITLINREHLHVEQNRHRIELMFNELAEIDNVAVLNIPAYPSMELKLDLPDPHTHFFYHRYILEYYSTLSVGNWILILESLLLEHSVIFYSTRLQRITSCITASLSLLYPLIWPHLIYLLLPVDCIEFVGCPTPFVAGIHSDFLEDAKRFANYGVRLVDLDSDIVYGIGETTACLPSILRQWLLRQCNASHSAVLHHLHHGTNIASITAAFLVEPYLQLMAILLGGYRAALQHNQPTPSSVGVLTDDSTKIATQTSFDQSQFGTWYFDRNIFIMSRGKEIQTFLMELLNSQMVLQFIEARVKLLNSELAFIPPDEFEDCIDRVQIPTRFTLSDLMKLGRIGLDRFIRKFKNKTDGKRIKIGRRAIYQSNNPIPPLNISAPIRNGKSMLSTYTIPKPSSILSNTSKSSVSLHEPDLIKSVDEKLHINTIKSETMNEEDTPVLLRGEPKSMENKILLWERLSSLDSDDGKLNDSERNTRSLLTSILAELPNTEHDWPRFFSHHSTATGGHHSDSSEDVKSLNCGLTESNDESVNSDPIESCKVRAPRRTISGNTNSEFYKNWLKFESASATEPPKPSLFNNLIEPHVYVDPVKAFDFCCSYKNTNQLESEKLSESPQSLSDFDPFPINKNKQ